MADDSTFAPASYEGKPRHLRGPEREILDSFWKPMTERLKAMSPDDLALLIRACRHVSPVNCGWYHYGIAELLHDTASAIEARRAEAAKTDSVHESAAPKEDAQTPPLSQDQSQ